MTRVTDPCSIRYQIQTTLNRKYGEADAPKEIHRLRVSFKQDRVVSEEEHGLSGDGWECKPMNGLLKFWFTKFSSYIIVKE